MTLTLTLTPFLNSTRHKLSNEVLLDFDLDLDLWVTLTLTLTPFLNSTHHKLSNEVLLDYDLELTLG